MAPKALLLYIITLSIGAVASAQTPAVSAGGILNHFSFALPGMPNSGIARGAIFDIYGTNIGPSTLTQAPGFPLPAELGGTRVQVTVAGTTVDILLFFTAQNQIVGLLPSRTPAGSGTLVVIRNGVRSAPAAILVVQRNLGILSLSQNGQGAAVMQVGDGSGNVLLNSITNSARPGQVGVFYGTGLGPVPFDESRGAPLLNLDPPILAYVGSQPARVLFQGRVPGLAGLDQINLEIPEGVKGCYVTVWFRTGLTISNLTTISVDPDGECDDPIPSGGTGSGSGAGTLRAAGINLVRSGILFTYPTVGEVDIVSDSGAGAFSVTEIPDILPASPASPVTMIGNCIVGPLVNAPPPTGPQPRVSYLDAGPVLTVSGPNGVKQLARQPTGYASILGMTPFPGQAPAPPPLYLVPGTYTVDNGSGGPDVPAFRGQITIPSPAFAWSNRAGTATVDRTAGVEITWEGGDQTGFVDIAGTSLLPRSGNQPVEAGGYFSCRVAANLGRFRIGPDILLFLPPSAVVDGTPSGVMTVANTVTPVDLRLPGFTQSQLNSVASFSRPLVFR